MDNFFYEDFRTKVNMGSMKDQDKKQLMAKNEQER